MSELRDVAFVAKALGISNSSVRALVDRKQIGFVDVATTAGVEGRRNRVLRFTDDDIRAFLLKRHRAAQEPRQPAQIETTCLPATVKTSRLRADLSHLPGATRFM